MNISSLKGTRKLDFTGGKGKLDPTPGQINAIRMFVYNYNVKVKESNLENRKMASQTITKLYNAVTNGEVKKRTERPTNSHVTIVGGYYRLVQRLTSEEVMKDALRMQIEMELERYLG